MAALIITFLQIMKLIVREGIYIAHRHVVINGQSSTVKEFLCI